MGQKTFIIDTNIVIYYIDNKVPTASFHNVNDIFKKSFNISTITRMEILGWHRLTSEIRKKYSKFLSNANVIYVDKKIEQLAIQIKQGKKTSVPDAIIAATALSKGYTLVTRNEDDFKHISGLKIYNPF